MTDTDESYFASRLQSLKTMIMAELKKPVQVSARKKKQLASIRQGSTGEIRFIFSQDALTMPSVVVEAIARSLTLRFLGDVRSAKYKDAKKMVDEYLAEVRQASKNARIQRKREICSPRGKSWDLSKILERVLIERGRIFSYHFEKSAPLFITWSSRKMYRTLGRYYPESRVIEVSRLLDQADVPEFVIEGIIFHELIHAYLQETHPNRGKKGARVHDKEFKALEQTFENLERMEAWLKDFTWAYRKSLHGPGKLR